MPSAGKYPSNLQNSLQNLHPSSLSYVTSLLGFSFLPLWARWAMLAIHLHCPRTCVLASSRTTTPVMLPPADSGSVLSPAPGLHFSPARTFRLCFHLLLSSSSKGPCGSAPADAHILGFVHPPPLSHPPLLPSRLPLTLPGWCARILSPDNGALMVELVSTFTFV